MPLDAMPTDSTDRRDGARTQTATGAPPLPACAGADGPLAASTASVAPVACSWCTALGVYCRGLCRRCYRKALTVECDGVTLPPTARMGRPPSHGHHLVDLVMMAGPDQKRLVMDALKREAIEAV